MADPKKPVLNPVKIVRDVWIPAADGTTERIASGQIVELPLAEAKALIASGVAERADPLPGER